MRYRITIQIEALDEVSMHWETVLDDYEAVPSKDAISRMLTGTADAITSGEITLELPEE